MAVSHGAHSERVVHSLAAQLAEWLTAERPDLAASPYRLPVGRLARAEAVASLLAARLGDPDAEDSPALEMRWRAAERLAAEASRECGLSPGRHAALQLRRAEAVREVVDLEALRQRGREARARALEAGAGGGAA